MNRFKGSVFAFLSTSIFAVNFVSMKVLVDYFPTMLLIALRFLMASGFLFILGKGLKLSFKIKDIKDFKLLILTGFLGMSFYYIFFTFALKFISAPLTSLLCSTIPIITIFIYSFIKKTPIDHTLVIAFIISIFGVNLAIDLDVITNNLTGLFIGVSLMIISILGWIYYTIKVEDLMKSYDTLVVLTYQSLAGGCINLVLSIFQMNQVIAFTQSRLPFEVIGHLLFVSLFGSAVGYYLFNLGIKHLGVTLSSAYNNIMPGITLIASALLLGSVITPRKILGISIVMTMTFFVTFKDTIFKKVDIEKAA